MTKLMDVLLDGAHGDRPAATAVGKGGLFACSTHGLIYQSDGATWTTWATLGGVPSFESLADVDWTTPPADGQIFAWDATAEKLKPIDAPDGGGGGGGSTRDVDNPNDAYWANDAMAGYNVEFDTDGTALPAPMAWVNQGTGSYESKIGTGVLTDSTTSGDVYRIINRTIPTETSWVMFGKLAVAPIDQDYWGCGLIVRDAASSRFAAWGPSRNGGWVRNLAYWLSPTATNGGGTHQVLALDGYAPWYPYWAIRKNSATSWDFLISRDGITWVVVDPARNLTGGFVANPSHVGFGIYRNGRIPVAGLAWLRFRTAL